MVDHIIVEPPATVLELEVLCAVPSNNAITIALDDVLGRTDSDVEKEWSLATRDSVYSLTWESTLCIGTL